jgi:hypothetical protein
LKRLLLSLLKIRNFFLKKNNNNSRKIPRVTGPVRIQTPPRVPHQPSTIKPHVILKQL